ncbi:MAG: NUDIX domain-containing protein [Proteobacteria bacterium]|nr:NUDIX domain-containing protein [Pseudomonadota bacterium]
MSGTLRLVPAPAAAAILIAPDGRYVLQLRDDFPWIWFPGCWGLFGGAIDAGEDPMDAARREVREEIGVEPERFDYFSRLDIDFAFAGGGILPRYVYEVKLSAVDMAGLRIAEGQRFALFPAPDVLLLPKLVPYDAFMLHLHVKRDRIDAKP